MNISKPDITDNQKKIIVIGLSGIFVFFLVLVFLYLPASHKISSLKQELSQTQQQIKGIEMLLAGAQSRQEAIRLLKQKQQYLSNKFPHAEEGSLRFIPEIARKMNIEVISIHPQTRSEFLSVSGKQNIIDSRVVQYLPVTLELTCFYKDLVKYLLELDLGLPAFISVESLSIKKENLATGKIRAIVELNLYLLK